MGQEITVETSFNEAGLVTQRIMKWQRASEDVASRVMDTAEQHVHDALVAMGWTPPGEGIASRSSGMTVDTVDEAGNLEPEDPNHLTPDERGEPERQPRKAAPRINR